MDKTFPGYDRKNAWLYRSAIAVTLLASILVCLKCLLGTPPDFVTKPANATWLYALSSIVSAFALSSIKRNQVRGSLSMVASTFAFVVAGFLSGFPQKPLWILLISSVLIFLIVILLGDKADLLTRTKSIKIKLPW